MRSIESTIATACMTVAVLVAVVGDASAQYKNIVGFATCEGEPLPYARVSVGNSLDYANENGFFWLTGNFSTNAPTTKVRYLANVESGGASTKLEIINEFGGVRVDTRATVGTAWGNLLYIEVDLATENCRVWKSAVHALEHYHEITADSPPAGELTIKRWSSVSSGSPHTYYDVLTLPTNFTSDYSIGTFFHEFGHVLRHVADGSEAHWTSDNVAFIYGRSHDLFDITDMPFSFNEGWANYWREAACTAICSPTSQLLDCASSCGSGLPNDALPGAPSWDYLDFSEHLIGVYLYWMAQVLGTEDEPDHAAMVEVLIQNPGTIHSLYEFEEKYCEMYNAYWFCSNGKPWRDAPDVCPQDFTDTGETCSFNNVFSRPWHYRGLGTVPNQCGPGKELDAGLCYPECDAGYVGVGPVCWQTCPSGWNNAGAFCWKGWSSFWKDSYGRGVGTVPTVCGAGKELDAGLCYPECSAGYDGLGPYCWGPCPDDFVTNLTTCYHEPNSFASYTF